MPEALSSRAFSGRFNLRVGAQRHRKLAMEAAEKHLSLNQYILRRLTKPLGCDVKGLGSDETKLAAYLDLARD